MAASRRKLLEIDGPQRPQLKYQRLRKQLVEELHSGRFKPGESLQHVHRTLHLQGSEPDLDRIARAALGVGLAEIRNAFQ